MSIKKKIYVYLQKGNGRVIVSGSDENGNPDFSSGGCMMKNSLPLLFSGEHLAAEVIVTYPDAFVGLEKYVDISTGGVKPYRLSFGDTPQTKFDFLIPNIIIKKRSMVQFVFGAVRGGSASIDGEEGFTIIEGGDRYQWNPVYINIKDVSDFENGKELDEEDYENVPNYIKGPQGEAPEHEWNGTSLKFKKPDKTWGDSVDLKGADGADGDKGDDGHVPRIYVTGESSGAYVGGFHVEPMSVGVPAEYDAGFKFIVDKGGANGFASLDGNAKVPLSQLQDFILGQMLYGGTLNASNGSAQLSSDAKSKLGTILSAITLTNNNAPTTGFIANEGIYYITETAGSFAAISFKVGDWLVSTGSAWKIIQNSDAVTSVAGKIGTVVLDKNDVGLLNADNTSDVNKPVSTATQTALNNKVDKIAGKGLSSEDYTYADKSKLDGIESGANYYTYTHPSNHPASIITQDSNCRFVSDTEKSVWNAKAGTTAATTSAAGLMSETDKSKLDGIESGANYFTYAHPSNHPASIITQDSSNRFVTDTEKSVWNAKAGTTAATTSAAGLMSETDKSKLDGIESGAQVNTVLGVKGNSESTYRVGNVNLTAGNVGAEPAFTKNEAFNKSFGISAGSVCEGNDSRLSNARTPLTHTHSFDNISGMPITLAGFGITDAASIAQLNSHTNNATAHVTATERSTWNAKSNFDGNYNNLTNKPTTISGFGITDAASLDINRKIPLSQLQDFIVGQMLYGGTLNAGNGLATLTSNVKTRLGTSANTITLTNNNASITGYTANEGIYYVVSTAGSFAEISFKVGDWLVSAGSAWRIIQNSDAVTSVAGKIGAVSLDKQDVGLGSADNTSDVNKPVSTATQTALNNKVDKIAGKGLSSEDYTYADKSKLDGIESGANYFTYAHPSNHPASMITQDASNRFVTDTEKSTWNAKSNFDGNYNNLSNKPASLPASDVYAWAKTSIKPTYNFSEIGSKPTTLSGYGIINAAASSHTHSKSQITDFPSSIVTSVNGMAGAVTIPAGGSGCGLTYLTGQSGSSTYSYLSFNVPINTPLFIKTAVSDGYQEITQHVNIVRAQTGSYAFMTPNGKTVNVYHAPDFVEISVNNSGCYVCGEVYKG